MAYYDVVEDFSDQWWSLVHSSPCFRDYWLRECFQDLQSDPLFPDEDDLLDSVFDCLGRHEKSRSEKELIAASALRWNNSKAHGKGNVPRYGEKAPKVVNVKLSPRPIRRSQEELERSMRNERTQRTLKIISMVKNSNSLEV